MDAGKANANTLDAMKHWLLLGALALVAVSVGLSLPQMLAGSGPVPRTEPPRETGVASGLPHQPPAWPEPPDLGGMVLRMVIGTVIVLGLCGALLWFGSRHLRGPTAGKSGDANSLHVLATLPLGQNAVVYLVQADEQRVVVGVDRTGVQGVVVLPEPFEESLGKPREGEASPTVRPQKAASIREFFA